MGREIRRVPPNWEHPTTECRCMRQPCSMTTPHYQPCSDHDYETASREWSEGLIQWEKGEHPDRKENDYCRYYWEWFGDPPDEETCRPKFTEEATWYQVYETVSDGSPVSPPFATKEELARYLSEHGDFWYQRSIAEGRVPMGPRPTYEAALQFVNDGHAFSMAVIPGKGVLGPYQQTEL